MTRTQIAATILVVATSGCVPNQANRSTSRTSPAALASIALPGATPGGVYMDYLAYDHARHRVWVPAGNTAKVDVIDVSNGSVASVEGFPTQEMERNGKKRIVGPSSATVGDGVVFVGNRGNSTVCAVDATSLVKGACVEIDSMPDGLAYVSSAKEVWVTTPRAKAIVILDAASPNTLTVNSKMEFSGEPEGFAVDEARGVFYTNLEDKDRTLAIDISTRQITHTWMPGCGEDGPKGLALDRALNFLFVACADQTKVLDAGHDGQQLSSLATGDGVDNIDYIEARHELYAGAGRAAKLTVATVDATGKLTASASVATATGARNAVVTDEGVAYLTDSAGGKILVVTPAAHH
jgi:hypothetical protein